MPNISTRLLSGLALLALLAGCSPAPAAPAPTALPTATLPGALTPYTAPPTPRPSLPPSPPPTPLALPSPSPTPLTHAVRSGEDMGGIAYRYGVTVAELIAANPAVDPRAMRVGTLLVIPASARKLDPAATPLNPSPTPLAVTVSTPDCWPAGNGGMWCFSLVGAPAAGGAVENILVRFRAGEDGAPPLLDREVPGLLNRLPAGGRLPLAVYIPGPLPGGLRVSAELTAAFPLPEDDGRYLPAALNALTVQIAPDGLSAALAGQLQLDAGSAQTAWVAAVALDAQGRVVAVRRWEAASPLQGGTAQPVALTIYSLGGAITQVETLTEARP